MGEGLILFRVLKPLERMRVSFYYGTMDYKLYAGPNFRMANSQVTNTSPQMSDSTKLSITFRHLKCHLKRLPC